MLAQGGTISGRLDQSQTHSSPLSAGDAPSVPGIRLTSKLSGGKSVFRLCKLRGLAEEEHWLPTFEAADLDDDGDSL